MFEMRGLKGLLPILAWHHICASQTWLRDKIKHTLAKSSLWGPYGGRKTLHTSKTDYVVNFNFIFHHQLGSKCQENEAICSVAVSVQHPYTLHLSLVCFMVKIVQTQWENLKKCLNTWKPYDHWQLKQRADILILLAFEQSQCLSKVLRGKRRTLLQRPVRSLTSHCFGWLA